MTERRFGWLLIGEEQDRFFDALSEQHRGAIRNARYGRNGWMIERSVKGLRALQIIEQTSRKITPRGMQMMNRLKRPTAHD